MPGGAWYWSVAILGSLPSFSDVSFRVNPAFRRKLLRSENRDITLSVNRRIRMAGEEDEITGVIEKK